MSNPYKTIYELRETIAELSEKCREQEADIEELLKEREWVSVKDRLPEIGKIIVIYSERTEYILGRFICEEEFIVEDGCPMSIAYLLGVQAYWTYLPEPPKEDTE